MNRRKKRILIGILLLCLLTEFTLLLCRILPERLSQKRFTRLADELLFDEVADNTLTLHYTLADPSAFGISEYTVTLPLYRPEEESADRAKAEQYLTGLQSVSAPRLSGTDKRLYLILENALQLSDSLAEYPLLSDPLSPHSGVQSQLPILLAEYTFRSSRDVDDYLTLLAQTDTYFSGILSMEKERAAAGLSSPAAFLESVRTQCDTIVPTAQVKMGRHFLQTTFRERLDRLLEKGLLTRQDYESYLDQNDRLLTEVLLPAYDALKNGLEPLLDESIPVAGLAAHPKGREYYALLLKETTGSSLSVEEIRTLLSNRLASESDLLRSLLKDASKDSITADLQKNFPLDTPTEMLADLQNRMKNDFPTIPGTPCAVDVCTVDKSLAPYCAPAFYLAAPLDDTASRNIYINTLKTAEGLELYTTLAHEGFPGHLYQDVYSNRSLLQNKEHPLRALLGCGGYSEGWAFYVECMAYDYASALFEEHGQPDEAQAVQTEKHSRNLQLCLYSLLDLMIHYDNASLQEASDYLETFGLADAAPAIYSYIASEPANYPKYYLGYLEILRLRERAKELWDDTYTDLDFHRFLLENGPADFGSLQELLLLYEDNTADNNE